MELKQASKDDFAMTFLLLIVPYGIETQVFNDIKSAMILLIVPYGIETDF